jgi:L-seryl-tRNA(Ser) seleniumtransferase
MKGTLLDRTKRIHSEGMEPSGQVNPDPRRGLPSVDRLATRVRELASDLPDWAVAAAVRETLGRAREELAAGGDAGPELAGRAVALARKLRAPHPTRVVNATGIVLHTNLGRAPLSPGAAAAAAAAGATYTDLELDLDSGRRGDRLGGVALKLCLLSGAEAALAVNNNAAAVLLALESLARGREVVVSRGELVEIGGSFRVPEIMERAGVRLVEVGSTNRTHLGDYERAIGPETALLLKVHRSNFEMRGFVAEVGLDELAGLGRARSLPVLEDLGSGTLVELPGLPAEAFAPARLRLGADLVCFSGDKLLGGPQAGIVLGRREAVAAMQRSPLARALRLDKLSLAALDWTLTACLDGRAERELPALRQLLAEPEALAARARQLAARLARAAGDAVRVEVVPLRSPVGGGSLPGFELEGSVVLLAVPGPAQGFAARMREAPAPVLARVRDDRVVVDVRTLLEGDEAAVEAAVRFAAAGGSR